MKKRKFAVLTLDQFDPVLCEGNQLTTFELAKFVKKKGASVKIISCYSKGVLGQRVFGGLKPRYRDKSRFEYSKCGVEVDLELFKYKKNEIWKYHQYLIAKLVQKLKVNSPDYVLTMEDDLLSLLAAEIAGIRGGVFFHSHYHLGTYKGINPVFRNILKNRDVYCVSDSIRRQVRKALGVESVLWYTNILKNSISSRKKIKQCKTIGYYSAPRKGDEIVKGLIGRMPDYRFVIMGRNCGIVRTAKSDNVQVLGTVKDARRFYEKISLLIAPSLHVEGFGRIIIEAMANGIPVIANAVGGIPEAVEKGGILVNVKPERADIGKLTTEYEALIRETVEDKAKYRSLASRALKRANKYFFEQKRRNNFIYDNIISAAAQSRKAQEYLI